MSGWAAGSSPSTVRAHQESQQTVSEKSESQSTLPYHQNDEEEETTKVVTPVAQKHKTVDAAFAMQLQSVSSPSTPTPPPPQQQQQQADPNTELKDKTGTLTSNLPDIDRTLLLDDYLLLKILSKLPVSQRNPNSLVCRRWLNLQGRLVRSLKVLDWEFLESGRLLSRFPNLTHVELLNGCVVRPHGCCV
ncbi:hypothetical protein SADUNF_Sadunf01G0101300 [Salix dunnii]|uniref:F-box domain-containing protein n=1 Tax=Salix dunnii TaxID=1413687 RepID=A0A835NB18_9ROSI|nr:hypothetical protein SADUNF_Sadunf01G0101300 [Salix dunnii]